MTDDEKVLLREYIVNGENTVHKSIYDGIANGLEAKRILYKASPVTLPGRPGMLMPYNMHSYARRKLSKDKHWLE